MTIHRLAAQPQWAARVAQLLHDEWAAFERWSSPAVIEARLRQRNASSHHDVTLVALTPAAEIAATASVIRYELDDDAEREYWLGEVLTVAAQRGKGFASMLVNACVQHCRTQGVRALYLYTPDQQAWYARLGWQVVELRQVGGETVSVMRLAIVA